MKKYWFRPKRYGYGFYPITWEGWIATFGLVGMIFLSAYKNGFTNPEIFAENGLSFVFDVVIVGTLSTVLFKEKVEGGLRWRWGRVNDKCENPNDKNLG
jgi:hypothetical protein